MTVIDAVFESIEMLDVQRFFVVAELDSVDKRLRCRSRGKVGAAWKQGERSNRQFG